MSVLAYKYKVYKQNDNHVRRLEKYLRTASQIYNHALDVRRRYYHLFHKTLDLYRLQSHMAKVRKSRHEWKIINSQSVQQICERIDEGYVKFFKRENKRPPQFRGARKYKSVTMKSSGYTFNGNELIINALKLRLKFHMSRPIDGKVQQVCVKRDAQGDFWIIVSVRKENAPSRVKPKTGKTAGFDFGLIHFLTDSEGRKFNSPLPLFNQLKEYRKLCRAISRKKKGSNGYRKARIVKAKLDRRIANLRREYHWQLANELTSLYDVLCFETLNMNEMKKMWGRKISDLSFYAFMKIVEHKCAVTGKLLVRINQWEATSKTCSSCGHKVTSMPLKFRKWTCPCCGIVHDRDVNAAVNILRVGTSTLGRGTVIPAPQVGSADARIPFL
ncbi:MAG: transposase [Prevotellaceae bacterium]|nr:transposase [Candidatus Colivivens equi]